MVYPACKCGHQLGVHVLNGCTIVGCPCLQYNSVVGQGTVVVPAEVIPSAGDGLLAAVASPHPADQLEIIGHFSATKGVDYHLLPLEGLQAGAERMMLGETTHPNPWNGAHRHHPVSFEWAMKRLSHAVAHCYEAMAELRNPSTDPAKAMLHGGNAGAIIFAGMVLACYWAEQAERLKNAAHDPKAQQSDAAGA